MTRTPSQAKLYLDQVASEQYRNFRLRDLPISQQLLLPVTSDISELVAAEDRIRRMFDAEQLAYLFTPWWEIGPKPTAVDPLPLEEVQKIIAEGPLPGQSAEDYMRRGPSLPGSMPEIEEGLSKPIKQGFGVDPLDYQYKPFSEFAEVENARKAYRDSELCKLRRERDEIGSTVDAGGNFPDATTRKRYMMYEEAITELERKIARGYNHQ